MAPLTHSRGCETLVNCSWSDCAYNATAEERYIEARNIWDAIVVCSAGNTRCSSRSDKVYPASYDACISVTTVGHVFDYGHIDGVLWKDVHPHTVNDTTTSYHHNDAVNICAPGYYITCTANGGGYVNVGGTSMSSPIVAGVVGMIKAVNPCLTADEVVDILLSTADPTLYSLPENAPFIGRLGTGRVDAYEAVKKAAETATIVLENEVLTGTRVIESNYAIHIKGNVTVDPNANILLKTRKEVLIDENFEVPLGATFEIDVNESNTLCVENL